eukprot:SAG31_NODE_15809_length_738_cov_0.588419_2_plen_104_part_01
MLGARGLWRRPLDLLTSNASRRPHWGWRQDGRRSERVVVCEDLNGYGSDGVVGFYQICEFKEAAGLDAWSASPASAFLNMICLRLLPSRVLVFSVVQRWTTEQT